MDYENENDTSWVRGMLFPGENLLWSGKPGKGHLFRKEDVFLIPFSVFWCGFAVFWEVNVIKHDVPFSFKLFGIPFVIVGIYITVGRFVFRWLQNKKSRYALTGQRIIVKTGKTVRTLNLTDLPRMTVTQRADGAGDIRFGETAVARRVGTSYERSPYSDSLLELHNIPDVNKVEYRIRTAVEQALRARQQRED
ncbi:MAG: hypothetical protein IJJ99_09810 [Oscillospiraceae bacterium]|nr:hypothetical protein [Oscillospiraceae bacterium]